jgi:hypothetical protein
VTEDPTFRPKNARGVGSADLVLHLTFLVVLGYGHIHGEFVMYRAQETGKEEVGQSSQSRSKALGLLAPVEEVSALFCRSLVALGSVVRRYGRAPIWAGKLNGLPSRTMPSVTVVLGRVVNIICWSAG